MQEGDVAGLGAQAFNISQNLQEKFLPQINAATSLEAAMKPLMCGRSFDGVFTLCTAKN